MSKKNGLGETVIGLAILFGAYYYFFGSSSAKEASAKAQEKALKDMQWKQVESYLQQYEIIKKHGTNADLCLHSNIVKGHFLGVKDEANYAIWKGVAERDCKAAGVPIL